MAELFGNNMFAVLVFDENDKLVDSLCNCCFGESCLKNVLQLTRKNYKDKMREWFYD